MLLHTDQTSWGQTHFQIPKLVTTVTTSDLETPLWKPGDARTVPMPCLRREAGVNESYRVYLQSCGVWSKKEAADDATAAFIRGWLWEGVDICTPPKGSSGSAPMRRYCTLSRPANGRRAPG
jgi:hypothetical protein